MPTQKTIVVDPGHGGIQPGACYHNLRESDINLAVAKLLMEQLEPDYKVIITRGSDVTVGLSARADIANKNKAHLFVSLHCNAAGDPKVEGLEVLYHEGSKAGKDVAGKVEMHTKAIFSKTRGLKPRDDLAVLNMTQCPAILVEMGFLSNPKEAKMLSTGEFHLSIAKAIASGIKAYLA